MTILSDLLGTMRSSFSLGNPNSSAFKLKNNNGTAQIRDFADNILINLQCATPDSDDDVATKGSSDTAIAAAIAAAVNNILNKMEGRITLTTATPITTSDVTAAETIYFTPMERGIITLYDGSSLWEAYTLTEISIAVPDTTDTGYDIFVYDDSGTLTLELVAWTSLAARATELALQNGIKVKSGSPEKRYIGSFQTGSVSGQVANSKLFRHLWNMYNRVEYELQVIDATLTWTYDTDAFRQANAATTNQVEVFTGIQEEMVDLVVTVTVATLTGIAYCPGIGINSTSTNSANLFTLGGMNAAGILFSAAKLKHRPVVGRTYYVWQERTTAGTATISGTTGTRISGMEGTIKC